MKLPLKCTALGTLTALLYFALNFLGVWGGLGPVVGIIGFIGLLPASLLPRQMVPAAQFGTRILILLLIESLWWGCFWYVLLRRRGKREKPEV
jgi:membrane-bound ClpP family serine protease